jgi:hypothetical protein
MSSTLQITATVAPQNKNLIFFNEDTPDQSATYPEGWGGTNPLRSDIYTADPVNSPAALVIVTESDGTVTSLDVISLVPPLYIIGTNAVFNPLALTQQVLGKAAGVYFKDGTTSIELAVQGLYGETDPQLSFTSLVVKQFYFYENVKCCVANLLLAAEGCGCENGKKKKAMEAKFWLDCITAAVSCTNPQFSKADCFLEVLQAICASEDCGCGC